MSLNLIPATATPLHDLLTRAAFAPLPDIGWIRVTGEDRVRWLNGMVTNNIAALSPGEGCYNFFLNAQGRIQGDCTAWMQEDCILLETAADRIPAMLAMLEHFIIMDDVELQPLDDLEGILIAGPQALAIVQALGTANHAAAPCSAADPQDEPLPAADSLLFKRSRYAGATVNLIRCGTKHTPRFELWSDASTAAAILDELATTSAAPATQVELEQLRILSGTPLYGTDIRNSDTAKDLPQETNQTRALHFAKGCYLGQEIVERIRSRGAVHRTFTGFLLTGEPATPGTILTADAKPIGELTSITSISSQLLAHSYSLSDTGHSVQIALGYIRREALDRGASITYPGGTATPVTLPFQLKESRPAHA